ncbi:exported hypothetical protein [Candidatus Terasakiella magnetica]|nr:exported hypothetical protein [Candidatus Terasakiella magnetica]
MRPIASVFTVASLLLCGAAQTAEIGPWAAEEKAAASSSAQPPARIITAADVADVQGRLTELGYGLGSIDGKLGPKTRKAINAYLTDRGLPAIGWVTADLIAEVEAARTSPSATPAPALAVTQGRSGRGGEGGGIIHDSQRDVAPERVSRVQRRLKDLGFYHGEVDGLFGGKLAEAIKSYQSSKSQPVTGWIFPDLVAELEGGAAAPSAAQPAAPVKAIAWTPKDMVGKTVHSQPGDLLGAVADAVVGADGRVIGVVVGIRGAYGNHTGDTLIPWGQVESSVGRPVVILPLSSDKARLLRRKPPELQLTDDQMLTSRLIQARARLGDQTWGWVADAVFEQSGALSHLVIKDKEGEVPHKVPASNITLVTDSNSVELKEVPAVERYESGAS